MDSVNLVELVESEMAEVEKIIGKLCKIDIVIKGSLSRTGFAITVSISTEAAVYSWNSTICNFNLTQFPGNCGIMISHETYQPNNYQKMGLSVPIQKMKEKISKHLKYTILLATTIPSNNADKSLLKAGFNKVDPLCFNSKRTGNKITTWIKML